MPTTVYATRPTISLDGQASGPLTTDLLAVLVEEDCNGLYRCELRLTNFGLISNRADYLYFGRDTLDFGKEITVELGAGDRGGQVFQGRISAIEADFPQQGGTQVVVLAEDELQALRMTRRTRTFEDVSDEDVIQQIANEHSLSPDLDVSGPTHKVLAQVNQSDLAFIRERARAVDAEVWLTGDTLAVKPRTARDAGTLVLEYNVNLLSFAARADLAHQCTELGVAGWDVAAKEAIEESADANAIGSELDGGTSGAAILEEAFAPRTEWVVHQVPLTSEEARALAEARFRRRARRFVTGTGLADGDARLRVGSVAELSGVGDLFNGPYVVTRVRHSYNTVYGFRTEFDVERPGLGPL